MTIRVQEILAETPFGDSPVLWFYVHTLVVSNMRENRVPDLRKKVHPGPLQKEDDRSLGLASPDPGCKGAPLIHILTLMSCNDILSLLIHCWSYESSLATESCLMPHT